MFIAFVYSVSVSYCKYTAFIFYLTILGAFLVASEGIGPSLVPYDGVLPVKLRCNSIAEIGAFLPCYHYTNSLYVVPPARIELTSYVP